MLSDGLGSIRQAVDEDGEVVAYSEFDPYGNPVQTGSEPYGFTGEWWQDQVKLLHLRARWYAPETGTFLSRDPIEGEPPYLYVWGNPVNRVDPSGYIPHFSEVGDRQHYSCRCGWIDTSHALSKEGFIDRVRQTRNKQPVPYWSNWVDFSESRSTYFPYLNIRLKLVESHFQVDKQAVMNDESAFEVALGMYLAFENMFETAQGYKGFELSQSSFSEEDLVSDLIGFHIGVGTLRGDGKHDSLQDFLELCGVVGYEMGFDTGSPKYNPQRYKELQQHIYQDYIKENGGFKKNNLWGRRPPGKWSGSITLPVPLDEWLDAGGNGCGPFKCDNQDQLPAKLTSITPRSPGDGWRMLGTNVDIIGYGQFWVPGIDSARTLNWAPINQ